MARIPNVSTGQPNFSKGGNMYCKESNDFVEEEFYVVCKTISKFLESEPNNHVIVSAWKAIAEKYNAKDRHYHDMRHIAEMIKCFKLNRGEQDAWQYWVSLFSIIYHDFENGGLTAEIDSAVVAGYDFCILFGKTKLNRFCDQMRVFVFDAILATRNHESDDEFIQSIIDADLERLMCPGEVWAPEIRKEYAQYEDDVFNHGRKLVLIKFATRNPIYYHLSQEQSDLARKQLLKQYYELI